MVWESRFKMTFARQLCDVLHAFSVENEPRHLVGCCSDASDSDGDACRIDHQCRVHCEATQICPVVFDCFCFAKGGIFLFMVLDS